MNVKSFLKLVEIQTKVASVIPLTMGTLYALYRFEHFYTWRFALMLVSLLSFDMATTAVNNYYDFKKASRTHGYGYETHNAIVAHKLKESVVVGVIVLLLLLAAGCGLLLVAQTGLLVFLLGGLSFLIGILYSFGPVPISRMPLGELFSGLFMGFVIIFISAYIHTDDMLAVLTLERGWVHFQLNLVETIYLFWFSVPAILGIANIMLANNICDIDEDVDNRRYTLPVYIGKANALTLFKLLYYVSYVDLALLLILGVHPLLVLLLLPTLIPLRRNLAKFDERQEKATTFVLSVKNFLLLNAARIAVLVVALLL
ncbi:1,4-dihydroxy-2-naphthoate polyprenyltransferase [Paenibacillus rhizophilus]|uniref:1,4-dihydroxy-2-naphthoate polyprenyltransferase n=1 Tax=Paenibacillus rhizophilus TaxID=1850366 RepID=A0A3N9P4F3_9BACL|nr:1,4-dihydroxy-2-naphthoate polyprenyltransferase [Paenibacillus rhizophilus]RQW10287.1 1,4-dihydroxy-2-naphthoate polyprenyltransferase [Paenibacillus rhizophilus]